MYELQLQFQVYAYESLRVPSYHVLKTAVSRSVRRKVFEKNVLKRPDPSASTLQRIGAENINSFHYATHLRIPLAS